MSIRPIPVSRSQPSPSPPQPVLSPGAYVMACALGGVVAVNVLLLTDAWRMRCRILGWFWLSSAAGFTTTLTAVLTLTQAADSIRLALWDRSLGVLLIGAFYTSHLPHYRAMRRAGIRAINATVPVAFAVLLSFVFGEFLKTLSDNGA